VNVEGSNVASYVFSSTSSDVEEAETKMPTLALSTEASSEWAGRRESFLISQLRSTIY